MYSCHDCAHLNKNIKSQHFGPYYVYGCSANGHTVGFMRSDKDLKWMGCSKWKPVQLKPNKVPEQISIFKLLQ